MSEWGSQKVNGVPLSERAATEESHVGPEVSNKATFSDHSSNDHDAFNESPTSCKMKLKIKYYHLRLERSDLETAGLWRSERFISSKEADSRA